MTGSSLFRTRRLAPYPPSPAVPCKGEWGASGDAFTPFSCLGLVAMQAQMSPPPPLRGRIEVGAAPRLAKIHTPRRRYVEEARS